MKNYVNMNRFCIKIDHEDLQITSHWLRVSSTDRESLLLQSDAHPFYELQYVLEGELLFREKEKEFVLQAGEFLLLAPGQNHEIIGANDHTRKLVFGFDLEFSNSKLESSFIGNHHMIRKETKILRTLIELLLQVSNNNSYVAEVQVRNLTEAVFFELLQILLPNLSQEVIKSVKRKYCSGQELIDEVISYIRSNYGGRFVTTEQLEKQFHMSEKNLYRTCLKVTGKTLRDLLIQERLRYVRELLAKTDYTLRKIAYLANFASEQSLIRFFKTHAACTPGKYRKDVTRF